MAINFPTPTVVGQTFTDPVSGSVYVCTVVGPPATWVGSGSTTNLDGEYLRLDASNDPVVGNLGIGGTNASPNVSLRTDGRIDLTSGVKIVGDYGCQVFTDDVSAKFVVNNAGGTFARGAWYGDGQLEIGGQLGTSPNIILDPEGQVKADSLTKIPFIGQRTGSTNADAVVFRANSPTGTEVATIDGEGIGQFQGVRFPATPVASSDPNTLDDYEEGTWTPKVRGSSAAGTNTYTFQEGHYIKIGRVVHCWGRFGLNTTSGMTNSTWFQQAPFPVSADTEGMCGSWTMTGNSAGITYGTGYLIRGVTSGWYAYRQTTTGVSWNSVSSIIAGVTVNIYSTYLTD